MELQEIFYIAAIVAFVLVIAFTIVLFYVLYRLNKMAKSSLETMSFAARDMQHAFTNITQGLGRMSLFGTALKLIRSFRKK